MIIEVRKNNFFENEDCQVFVEVDYDIIEQKKLKIIDKIKNMTRIHKGRILCVRYGEWDNDDIKFKHNEIVRVLTNEDYLKYVIGKPEKIRDIKIRPDKGERWQLSKEFGNAIVDVLGATIDYYVVKVIYRKNIRLAPLEVFYINRFESDAKDGSLDTRIFTSKKGKARN